MINDLVDRIPPLVKTMLLAGAIGSLTLAVGNLIDSYLVDSSLRITALLILGWAGITASWMVPLTFRIWEAMEKEDGTQE